MVERKNDKTSYNGRENTLHRRLTMEQHEPTLKRG
jgi:hypothetical protein